MGYVPGFQYDIFVSYASVDSPCAEGEKGWVEKYINKLIDRLRPTTSNNVEMFLDKKDIMAGDVLVDTLSSKLEKSATVLILLSQAYLKSKWCTMERDKFVEHVNKVKESDFGGISGFKRIFIVKLRNDVSEGMMPDEFTDIYPIEFFRKDNNAPLCWPDMLDADPFFFTLNDKLEQLGAGISKHLNELKDCQEKSLNNIPGKHVVNGGDKTTNEKRRFYEEILKECHGLIVVWGVCDDDWVFSHVEKIYAYFQTKRRNRPFGAWAIVKGPPPNRERKILTFNRYKMKKIDCTNGFDKTEMEKFFKELKTCFDSEKGNNTSPACEPTVFVCAVREDRELIYDINNMADEQQVNACFPLWGGARDLTI